ncbi:hypothetical protein CBS101457_005845 [Exobasidium rhododendri]|nr:hypothetical protein CBS101457_005845 [Exobasidium rhododendri]
MIHSAYCFVVLLVIVGAVHSTPVSIRKADKARRAQAVPDPITGREEVALQKYTRTRSKPVIFNGEDQQIPISEDEQSASSSSSLPSSSSSGPMKTLPTMCASTDHTRRSYNSSKQAAYYRKVVEKKRFLGIKADARLPEEARRNKLESIKEGAVSKEAFENLRHAFAKNVRISRADEDEGVSIRGGKSSKKEVTQTYYDRNRAKYKILNWPQSSPLPEKATGITKEMLEEQIRLAGSDRLFIGPDYDRLWQEAKLISLRHGYRKGQKKRLLKTAFGADYSPQEYRNWTLEQVEDLTGSKAKPHCLQYYMDTLIADPVRTSSNDVDVPMHDEAGAVNSTPRRQSQKIKGAHEVDKGKGIEEGEGEGRIEKAFHPSHYASQALNDAASSSSSPLVHSGWEGDSSLSLRTVLPNFARKKRTRRE